MSRFIKFKPGSDVYKAMVCQGYHKELILLSVIAERARREPCKITGLEAGQCFLGDFVSLGLSERQYRTAKKNLEKFGLATFKGTNKGTVGTLIDSTIYDINEAEGDRQATGKRRASDEQATTNKNVKKDKNEKKTTGRVALDLSSLPEGVSEQTAKDFIEHRKVSKKPLTQRAFDMCMKVASKAGDYGLTPDQVIDEAIVKGWLKPEPEWVAKSLKRDAGKVTPIRNDNGQRSVYDDDGQLMGWYFGDMFAENPEYRRQA